MSDASTISIDDAEAVPRRLPSAALRIVHPRELRARHPLTASVTTLGRAAGAGGCAIGHATVSRCHAELRRDAGGRHVLRDLGSRHGTRVGDELLTGERTLADGDVLRIGDVLVVYEVGAADDHAAVDRAAIPGDAPAIVALRGQLGRAAIDRAPVLVTGDTGTGKEWIARELHRLSGRRGPLVAVNCATLSPHLAEGQLFGHVKGAFTGAVADSDGWFRQADGGTLFLDELGELPLDLQPKLLRVAQDGVVQPLGASRAVAVDVRLCCATHRDLATEVEAGRFRRDLHARLARVELRVPRLAARRGDLLDWLDRLWTSWCRDRGVAPGLPTWRPTAAAAILANAWPDNLRGLERLVHELASRGAGSRPISLDELPGWLGATSAGGPATSSPATPTAPLAADEPTPRPPVPSKAEFTAAWTAHRGSVRALARHFGRDRRQIYRWLDSHGLRAAEGEAGPDDPDPRSS